MDRVQRLANIVNVANKEDNNKKFIDKDFPPTIESLASNVDDQERKYSEYEQIRASKLAMLTNDDGENEYFTDSLGPLDIKAGSLDNTYFQSCLSILAEKPERIRKLFTELDESDKLEPPFCVKITKNGAAFDMFVDDFIVCFEEDCVFTKSQIHSMWTIILEKAWAKIHGSYNSIINNFKMHETMRDLTGAPSHSYSIKQFPSIFVSIQYSQLMNYMVSLSYDKNLGDGQLQDIGLNQNYHYAVVDIGNARDHNGQNKQVLKIRNPWATEDDEDLWNSQKEEFPSLISDESTCWMSWDKVKQYFSNVEICQYNDQFEYSSLEHIKNQDGIYTFKVDKDGAYTFSVSQVCKTLVGPDQDNVSESGYTYSKVRMFLIKKDGSGDQYIDGVTQVGQRDIHLQVKTLTAGKYQIGVEVEWDTNFEWDQEFNLNCYGTQQVEFTHQPRVPYKFAINEMFRSLLEKTREQESKQFAFMKQPSLITEFCVPKDLDIQVIILNSKFGYHFKFIDNQSKKNASYQEIIDDEVVVVASGTERLIINKN